MGIFSEGYRGFIEYPHIEVHYNSCVDREAVFDDRITFYILGTVFSESISLKPKELNGKSPQPILKKLGEKLKELGIKMQRASEMTSDDIYHYCGIRENVV